MTCGGNCSGSGQANTAPNDCVVQEQLRVQSAAFPITVASSTSRPSIDIRTMSCAEDTCCSLENANALLQPSPSQSSVIPTAAATSTTQKSEIAIPDVYRAKKPAPTGTCGSKNKTPTGCCTKRPITNIQPVESSSNGCSSLYSTLDTMPLPKEEDPCSQTAAKQNCCTSEKANTTMNSLEVRPSNPDVIDPEKSGIGKEHAVISVSGMTCTGCETKLQRTLASLPYVSKLRTSLILARAEFEIDTNFATIEDVIKYLAHTTEFKCEQISTQGSSIDLICTEKAVAITNCTWPDGVRDIGLLDKDTIRVAYDARVVGARDLIERGWEDPMQLAPMRPDQSLYAGNRHVRHMGFLTLTSACLTIPVLVMAWAPLPDREIAYSSASLALATVVQVCIAGPFYPKALKALVFSRVIEMDLLIVLSTSAAYVFSIVSFGYMIAGDPLSTGKFFETSTLLVTLIMVGRWVASLARQKVRDSAFTS